MSAKTGQKIHAERFSNNAIYFGSGYCLLLIYGTLYPWQGWHQPANSISTQFVNSLSSYASRADLLTNILVYIPFGMFLALWLQRFFNTLMVVAIGTFLGMMLSLSLEITQAFLPQRTTSLLDLFLNTAGSAGGAILPVVVSEKTIFGDLLHKWRYELIAKGTIANLGLIAVALWALSHLSPLVPSLDVGNLKNGLRPLWSVLHNLLDFNILKSLSYCLSSVTIGLLAFTLWRKDRRSFLLVYACFLGTILALKILVISRQLSLEAVVGVFFALPLVLILSRQKQESLIRAAIILLIIAFMVEQLRPGSQVADTRAFSWSLFKSQMLNIHGFADIFAAGWPFVGLAYLVMVNQTVPGRAGQGTSMVGRYGLLIVIVVFCLEWAQTFIPGRQGDLTDVLIPLVAWVLSWLYARQRSKPFPNQ